MVSTGPAPPAGHPFGSPAAMPSSVRRRPLLRRALVIGALTMVFGLGGVAMLALINAQNGLTATALGLVLGAVVIGIVVPVFLWLDRFEREPPGMLLFAFLWGACVATLGAALLNELGGYLIGASQEDSPSVAIVVAPLVEESLKGLAPLLLLLFRRREFDGVLDGIVYAGLSAAGFAFVENILYLANGYHEAGQAGLMATFFLRVLMSPFAHPMFTICIGIGLGVAALSRRGRLVRYAAPLLGWVCAVLLHGFWNAAAVLSLGGGWFLLYVLVQVPLFLGFVAVLVWARRHESRLIGKQLQGYVALGWLTPAEVAMLASMPQRRYARQWAQLHGGATAKRDMHQFQDASSELAMLRARMTRTQQASPQDEHEERDLLHLIADRRQQFLGSAIYRRFEVLGHL